MVGFFLDSCKRLPSVLNYYNRTTLYFGGSLAGGWTVFFNIFISSDFFPKGVPRSSCPHGAGAREFMIGAT